MPDRPRRRSAPRAPAVELPAEPVATSMATATLRREPGAPTLVTLVLDGAESSCLDLADPAHLEFEYMEQMALVVEAVRPTGPLRALHLGAAGCALPRALEARRPGSTQVAVEIDEVLARLVREWFDLPRSPRLRIRTGDARAVLESLPDHSWDVVVRDVFARGEVPRHVRTIEAARSARRVLTADGLYLANLTDHPPLHRARAEVAALQDTFAHVLLVADPAILRGRRYGNVLLAASAAPLPVAALDRALRRLPLPVRLVEGGALRDFRGGVAAAQDETGVPARPTPPG